MVHESLDLVTEDLSELDGIPVTTPARTVVDLGATSPGAVPVALDAGLRKNLFSLDEVDRFVARVAKRGRRGVGVIRPLIEVRLEWQGLTESDLEDLFRRIVAGSSLPMPEPQYTLRDEHGRFICRADFAYVDKRALIELDSEKHHMDPTTFGRDREKQNLAMGLGWRVYRFTWRQLVDTPDQVLSILADICAKQGTDIRKNSRAGPSQAGYAPDRHQHAYREEPPRPGRAELTLLILWLDAAAVLDDGEPVSGDESQADRQQHQDEQSVEVEDVGDVHAEQR